MNTFVLQTIKASDTLEHQPTVLPIPYVCGQPYHQGNGSMDSDFGHISKFVLSVLDWN